MSLQEEINLKSSKIFRDSYQMSIGELINLYKDGEMDIHPEFQRVFRWSDYQKTKLIESIMLNIPIPSIFVSQNEDGIWDVIDGVQRLSTIFKFVGVFKNDFGEIEESLTLQKTDYLPSFEGVKWDDQDTEKSFSKEQQLFFKRARIDIIIVKKESDPNTKYELFQRLNTGGSSLSDQEVRNCLMIMTNKRFYDHICMLEKNQFFNLCVPISDRKADEQYKMELILRLLVSQHMDFNIINNYRDFSELLDKETIKLCESDFDFEESGIKFEKTFEILHDVLGEEVFKKYNGEKHIGPFLSSAFQGIAAGVYSNIGLLRNEVDYKEKLKTKIPEFYQTIEFTSNTIPGIKAIPRFRDLTIFGKAFFRYED